MINVPECYFSLPSNLKGRIRSPHPIADDTQTRLQIGAHVPGIRFLETRPDHIDLTLEHVPSLKPRLEENGPRVSLYAPAGISYPPDIHHLLYGVVRRELMKQDFFIAHAACVGKDGRYHLIVGHSGSGKTTLAQNLIDRYGYTLFSGNKTVLSFEGDNLTAIAGTRTMTALDAVGVRHAYELPADLYVSEPKVRIASIALVRINDGVEERAALPMPASLHTLYTYLMDTVNADVIVNAGDVFDGTPPDDARSRLVRSMGHALPHIPVMKISGSLSFMEKAMLSF